VASGGAEDDDALEKVGQASMAAVEEARAKACCGRDINISTMHQWGKWGDLGRHCPPRDLHITLLGGSGGMAPCACGNVLTSFRRSSSNSEYLSLVQ
jgi:hypothetical protein